jgi:hypothetical protein
MRNYSARLGVIITRGRGIVNHEWNYFTSGSSEEGNMTGISLDFMRGIPLLCREIMTK